MPEKPVRRFAAEYAARILREADQLSGIRGIELPPNGYVKEP